MFSWLKKLFRKFQKDKPCLYPVFVKSEGKFFPCGKCVNCVEMRKNIVKKGGMK